MPGREPRLLTNQDTNNTFKTGQICLKTYATPLWEAQGLDLLPEMMNQNSQRKYLPGKVVWLVWGLWAGFDSGFSGSTNVMFVGGKDLKTSRFSEWLMGGRPAVRSDCCVDPVFDFCLNALPPNALLNGEFWLLLGIESACPNAELPSIRDPASMLLLYISNLIPMISSLLTYSIIITAPYPSMIITCHFTVYWCSMLHDMIPVIIILSFLPYYILITTVLLIFISLLLVISLCPNSIYSKNPMIVAMISAGSIVLSTFISISKMQFVPDFGLTCH